MISNKSRKMEEQVLRVLVDDLLVDLCFDLHQQVKTVGMSLDELYEVDSLDHVDYPPIEPQSLVVTCSRCKRQVHASRYAPHLEKCIVGNRRQAAIPRATGDATGSAPPHPSTSA